MLRIEIENNELDLPKDDSGPAITYGIKSRSGINVHTGSRSEYSLKLPATNKNDYTFKRFWDVSEVNEDIQELRRASIEVSGLPFFKGKALLKSADLSGGQYGLSGGSYNVSFFGDNIDWVDEIKELKLYELNMGGHTFDRGSILGAWGNLYVLGDKYLYTLIKTKDWANYGKVDPLFESTLGIFIKSFIDEIFKKIGYSIESSFFQTKFFKQAIMPFLFPDKLKEDYSADYLDVIAYEPTRAAIGFEVPIILSTQPKQPLIGANPYSTGTGIYTVPFDGFYLINIESNVSNIVGSVGFRIDVYLNGDLITSHVTAGSLSGAAFTSNTNLKGEGVFQFSAGDIIQFAYSANLLSGSCNFDYKASVIGEANIQEGMPIDFKYIIPKNLLAIDFLKGIAHAFNLCFETDVANKIIYIDPSDDYPYSDRNPFFTTLKTGFYGAVPAIDWTNKLDLSKTGTIESIVASAQAIRLSWKYDPNDKTLEALSKDADIKLMQATYKINTHGGEEVIENPFFSATACLVDDSIQAPDSQKTPILPIIWANNYLEDSTSSEAPTDILPRILISEQLSSGNNGRIVIEDGAGGSTTAICPCCYMVDYNNTNGSFISLSFGSEEVNGVKVAGLMERFYLQDLNRRRAGKELNTNISLNIADINSLSFRRKIMISNSLFILNEVNSFRPMSKASTRVVMTYDSLLNFDASSYIYSSPIRSKLIR